MEHLLELHGLETAELIHRYHQERIKEQNELEESEYGQIAVKAQFIDNSLNIQILNARKLRPVDSNGKKRINILFREAWSWNVIDLDVKSIWIHGAGSSSLMILTK